jgi:UDP-4-amino-4,6-dideoxy-N-acetyl-beta-L-altrosamine N-acetyltransferase
MNLYLRALESDDFKHTIAWRNSREITDSLGGNKFYVSADREKKWIEKAIENDRINLHLIICLNDLGKPIGLVNLINIDLINRKAEFSIQIGDNSEHGKGYGYSATKLMLEYGFMQLNLNKIYLTVLCKNEKAINLYKKLNFSTEGLLRQEVFKNGEYNDVLIMSILKSEFNV